jgi:hypothetical protein
METKEELETATLIEEEEINQEAKTWLSGYVGTSNANLEPPNGPTTFESSTKSGIMK